MPLAIKVAYCEEDFAFIATGECSPTEQYPYLISIGCADPDLSEVLRSINEQVEEFAPGQQWEAHIDPRPYHFPHSGYSGHFDSTQPPANSENLENAIRRARRPFSFWPPNRWIGATSQTPSYRGSTPELTGSTRYFSKTLWTL